mmetsp:Transcript_17329/g.60960  ORF Transcript_17329/g.60960 Transcript_17329/m.60960 type:complete len:205 (-) Transcript_17329:912-1526(-)
MAPMRTGTSSAVSAVSGAVTVGALLTADTRTATDAGVAARPVSGACAATDTVSMPLWPPRATYSRSRTAALTSAGRPAIVSDAATPSSAACARVSGGDSAAPSAAITERRAYSDAVATSSSRAGTMMPPYRADTVIVTAASAAASSSDSTANAGSAAASPSTTDSSRAPPASGATDTAGAVPIGSTVTVISSSSVPSPPAPNMP